MMKKHTLAAAFAALFAIAGVAGADSNVLGAVQTNVHACNIAQSQSGLLNKQKISAGSIDSSVPPGPVPDKRIGTRPDTGWRPCWASSRIASRPLGTAHQDPPSDIAAMLERMQASM